MSSDAGPSRRIPHVYTIIFTLIVLTALAGLLLPPGAYERDVDGRVVAGSYLADAENPEAPERPRGWVLLFAVWQAPLQGIVGASSIIAFILVLGGTFKVIEETGAFDAAIRSAVHRLGAARSLVIPASMTIFAVGGAVFGMSEEIIPFVLLFVPIVRALGYHPMIGVAIPLVGSQIGFAGAMINPFTVGIAQGIAELPPLSGWEFRSVLWVAVTVAGIAYVARAAKRLPGPEAEEEQATTEEAPVLERRQVHVLIALVLGIGVILWGVGRFHWYVIEIGAVFLALGVIAGLVGRLKADQIAEGFVAGARDLVSAALVVGLARGIVVLAEDLGILDTVLHAAATGLGRLPAVVALNLMFFFQTALNFFIPSGSGQAALTIPIMAPLADLVGLTRQMAVLAFQLGDGFSNLIVPTSAVLMGSLEAGKVRYESWFSFIWPLQVILVAIGMAALCAAYWVGLGP